jgi:hypothetical protein
MYLTALAMEATGSFITLSNWLAIRIDARST